ncbi:hypothetical protein [Glutamicibacter creatinolyticus]|uniref:hypothetical protein n=1 Tax=Glutamicibacter creatinolyticus TaxID=162496 RepID=UPI0032164953
MSVSPMAHDLFESVEAHVDDQLVISKDDSKLDDEAAHLVITHRHEPTTGVYEGVDTAQKHLALIDNFAGDIFAVS